MSSYPVPGEFFENMSAPTVDESYEDYDDQDLYGGYADERRVYRQERIELDPLSAAVSELRSLARRLRAERHPLAHIPQQVATRLVDVRAPAPQPSGGEFEESPTGNCVQCRRALPMPTMSRGRPRTKCTACSPSKPKK